MSSQVFHSPDERDNGDPKRSLMWTKRRRSVAVLGACFSVMLLIAYLLLGPMNGTSTLGQLSALAGSTPPPAAHDVPYPVLTNTPTEPAPTVTPSPAPAPTLIAIAAGSWAGYMGGDARSGYNAGETAITETSVEQLKQVWRVHAGGAVFSQPVVVNGLVYWGSWDGFEHATDSTTGRDAWKTYLGKNVDSNCQPPIVGVASTAAVSRITVRGAPTLVDYVGGGDGRLYALNALTGAVIWRTALGAPPATFLWSSPAVYQGSVYMGVASFGDCPLIRGKIVKLDTATGGVQRVFYTVPAGCLGGSVWGSIAINDATGMLYFATGNQGACGGSEPYTVAVVALRALDLAVAGAWQVPASEQFGDGDFGSTPILFTASIHGASRALLGVPNKSGILYAFDQANVSRGPVWRARIAGVGICPECGTGAIAPAAWDGTTILAAGGKDTAGSEACTATLRGLDPATGHTRWISCLTSGSLFGAVMAVPGVAVVGSGPTVVAISTHGTNAGKHLYTFRDPGSASTWFYSPAAVSNGVLYVGNASGNLYALGL